MLLMDENLSDTHRRVIGSGMLIIDAAAVRMLDLLEDRNSPAAMKLIEGSVTESEREQIRAGLLQLRRSSLLSCGSMIFSPQRKTSVASWHRTCPRYGWLWRTADLQESGGTGPCRSPAPNHWKQICRRCWKLPTGSG